MPNLAISIITIEGPESDLKRFYNENRSSDGKSFDINRALPKPKFKPEDSAKEQKWIDNNLSTSYIENEQATWRVFEPTKVEGLFSSAWVPPIQWLVNLSVIHPELTFKVVSLDTGQPMLIDLAFVKGLVTGISLEEEWVDFLDEWQEIEDHEESMEGMLEFADSINASPNMKDLLLNEVR